MEIYCLIVLKVRNLKSRYCQGPVPSQGSKGGAFLVPSSFWWRPAVLGLLGLWLCHFSPTTPLSVLHITFPVCVCVCPDFPSL